MAKKKNMSQRAVLFHILGDMTKSFVVLLAAITIFLFPEWLIIDPICTCLFSVIVFVITIPIFKDCLIILMEAPPPDFDVCLLTS